MLKAPLLIIMAIIIVVASLVIGGNPAMMGSEYTYQVFLTPEKQSYVNGDVITWKVEVVQQDRLTQTRTPGTGVMDVSFSVNFNVDSQHFVKVTTPLTIHTPAITLSNDKFHSSVCYLQGSVSVAYYPEGIDVLPGVTITNNVRIYQYATDVHGDTINPTIIYYYGGTGLANERPYFDASEPLKGITTSNYYMQDENNVKVPASIITIGTEYILQPANLLKYSTDYTVFVGAGITDMAGNPLATTSWSAKTNADKTPPVFTITSPRLTVTMPTSTGTTPYDSTSWERINKDRYSEYLLTWQTAEIKGFASDASGISKVVWTTFDVDGSSYGSSGVGIVYDKASNSTSWYADIPLFPYYSYYWTGVQITVTDNNGNSISSVKFALANHDIGGQSLIEFTAPVPKWTYSGHGATSLNDTKVTVIGKVIPSSSIKNVRWGVIPGRESTGGTPTANGTLYSGGALRSPYFFTFTAPLKSGWNTIYVYSLDSNGFESKNYISVESMVQSEDGADSDSSSTQTDYLMPIIGFILLMMGVVGKWMGVFTRPMIAFIFFMVGIMALIFWVLQQIGWIGVG